MSNRIARTRRFSAPVVGLAGLALAAVLSTGAIAGSAHEPQPRPAAMPAAAVAVAPQAVVKAALEPVAPAVVPVVDVVETTLERLAANATSLDRDVLRLALQARERATASGLAKKSELLTVIDYSLPSTAKRLWVFDVATGDVLFNELVAHGKNTGDNFARRFSNNDGSLQTSIGLFRTVGTYYGGNGYSLKLDGLEPGFNDKAERRAVVMHGAPYVSEDFAKQHGRIGRSWGCPALSQKVAGKVIDTIKGGSLLFSYYPDQEWLSSSRFVASTAATLTAGTH